MNHAKTFHYIYHSYIITRCIKVLHFYNPSQRDESLYSLAMVILIRVLACDYFICRVITCQYMPTYLFSNPNMAWHSVTVKPFCYIQLSANSHSMRMVTMMTTMVIILLLQMSPREAGAFSMGGWQSKGVLDVVFSVSVSLVMVVPVFSLYSSSYWQFLL